MDGNEYEKLLNYFKRLEASIDIDFSFDQHTTASHIISRSVNLKVEFCSKRGLRQFLEHIDEIENLYEESRIRLNNPSVARAYDEYLLLLKLSK